MTFSFVEKSANEQTPEETLSVLFYELGRIVQCLHYTQRYGASGYRGYAEGELSDAVSMCRMYAEQRGFDALQVNLASVEAAKIRDVPTAIAALATALGRLFVLEREWSTLSVVELDVQQIAVGRMLYALRHIGHRNAWSFERLCEFGEQRYCERMHDLKKHGLSEQLKVQFRDCPGKPCEGCASEGTC